MSDNREKSEKLFDAVTDIRDDIVEGSERTDIRSVPRRWLWMAAAVAGLALTVIVSGVLFMPGMIKKPGTPGQSASGTVSQEPKQLEKYTLEWAQYPKMAPYPDESRYIKLNGDFDSEGFDAVYSAWRDSINAQKRDRGYADGLEGFFSDSTRVFLSEDGQPGENRLYSPLNAYMALAMLAETTGGESRGQILGLLGCSDIDTLRRQASDVWNATYRDDGAVTSPLADSVWLCADAEYNAGTLDSLARNYYASSFRGEMGSEDYNEALRGWLNSQTGGLLEQQVGGLSLEPETVFALASTAYFRSKWSTEYNPNATEDGIFHGAAGDTPARYMPRSDAADYYWDDSFAAIYQELESGGRMWFILPDADKSVQTVLDEGRWLDLVTDTAGWNGHKYLVVNSKLPKFDVMSETDLCDGLRQLGISDVFDSAVADFSPMSEHSSGWSLSRAQHAVRVSIDEEGVIAAAYTVMMTCGAAMPPEEEVDFVADRPFLFVIATPDGLPMFTGTVNVIR